MNTSADKYPGIAAEKQTLIIASLKLLLFILLMSYCLSKILLLTEDRTIYSGKGEFIAWYLFLSVFSLGMMLDASYVLGKKTTSATAEKRKGIVGTFLQIFVLPISPALIPRLVILAAAAGMAFSALSFLLEIF